MGYPRPTLGTLLRHLIDILDGAVEKSYVQSGLNYRPRFTPVVRSLLDLGPSSIRTLSRQAGITHSAVSQTVSQMKKYGLVHIGSSSEDARERIVSLTLKTKAMIPRLERFWAATNAATTQLDKELTMPLSDLLNETIEALKRRSFTERLERSTAKHKSQRNKKGKK